MALQAASLYDFSMEWQYLPTVQTELTPFVGLDHARDSLVELIGQTHLDPNMRALLKGDSVASIEAHLHCQQALVRWKAYFDDYNDRERMKEAPAQRHNSTLIVHILYIVAEIMLASSYTDVVVDAEHAKSFSQILRYSTEILQSGDVLPFAIDLGLVAMVYYVAIHCQVQSIRQEAFDLLSSHQLHEGYWSSFDALRDARAKLKERQRLGTIQLGYRSDRSVE